MYVQVVERMETAMRLAYSTMRSTFQRMRNAEPMSAVHRISIPNVHTMLLQFIVHPVYTDLPIGASMCLYADAHVRN
jgi:hypothetical protein